MITGGATRGLAVVALLLLLGACSGSPSPAPSPTGSTSDTRSSSPTTGALDQRELPDRDLVDLARRFRGLPADAPRLARTAPYGYQVGDRAEFSLFEFQTPRIYTATATVRRVTEHAYFFVEEGTEVSDATLETIGGDFESVVYPKVTAAFGHEWTPGVDSDPKITVLHANLSGAGGYFSGGDEYPVSIVPNSNQREMLYLDTSALKSPGAAYNALIAHELQHMIHWQAHADEDSWVNEGLSQVAAELVLGGPTGRENQFLSSPDTQLTFWPAIGGSSIHYAASELFFSYLLDHYGGRQNAAKLLAAKGDSIAGVTEYLAPFGKSFEDMFADWVVANYLDEDQGPYSHLHVRAKVTAKTTIQSFGDGDRTVHQFAADYLEIQPPSGGAIFSFKGSNEVSIGVPSKGGGFWWSNRGDGIDSRLTRQFDLGGLDRATLRFSTWYDIEKGWDYAYVTVSTDEGKTWKTLPGQRTTTDDPVQAAYGPGYTGDSGGWEQEEVDLSAYAGRKVLLRFEYVTDDATNLTGFAVNNIEIPELGFTDKAADANGWVAEGFELIERPLDQRFVVQVIANGPSPVVKHIPLDLENRAEISLDGPATIVVAAVTDGTAEEASYSWRLMLTPP